MILSVPPIRIIQYSLSQTATVIIEQPKIPNILSLFLSKLCCDFLHRDCHGVCPYSISGFLLFTPGGINQLRFGTRKSLKLGIGHINWQIQLKIGGKLANIFYKKLKFLNLRAKFLVRLDLKTHVNLKCEVRINC